MATCEECGGSGWPKVKHAGGCPLGGGSRIGRNKGQVKGPPSCDAKKHTKLIPEDKNKFSVWHADHLCDRRPGNHGGKHRCSCGLEW